MLQYIRDERGYTRALLDGRKALCEAFVERYRDQTIDRVYFIGSGSSWNVGMMAKPFIESLFPFEVSVEMPSRMRRPANRAGMNDLCVLISQSGQSTNTLNCALNAGFPKDSIIAVSENILSPVARASGLAVPLPWREPEIVGAKTKGVTCSVVISMLLFLELALSQNRIGQQAYDTIVAAFCAYCDRHAENVERSNEWYLNNRAAMANCGCMLILGQGAFLGAAQEGALKLLETIYRPVFAYEFEEYLHGVGNTLSDDCYMLIMTPDGEAGERTRRLTDFARQQGAKCYPIIMDAEGAPATDLSLMSSGNPYIDTLNYLIPVQLLSALLSETMGIDVDKPHFKGFSALMGTKARID